MAVIGLADIEAAQGTIKGLARNTPMKRSTTLGKMLDAEVYLKLENFQRTGSFKVRGALNKIHSLDEPERKRGVVAASAGNHAQGVAFAANQAGVDCDIFMPEGAAHAKVVATRAYGAKVHLVGRDYQAAFEAAQAFGAERNKVFVHAFDDPFIMAGQGTLGLEILDEVPDVDVVVVPIGGGGLIAGVAAAIKAKRPQARIVGVQAEGASTVAPSLAKGAIVVPDEVQTMADGIACRRLGELTFPAIQELVDEVVTVDESEIAAAILFLLERTKIAAEGAGAVALAAAMQGRVALAGKKVCIIVSGGNIDMTLMSRIIQRGLVKEGRIVVIEAELDDAPGAVADLLTTLGKAKANVLDIAHDRLRMNVPLHKTHVEVHVETRGPEHIARLEVALAERGYNATIHTT